MTRRPPPPSTRPAAVDSIISSILLASHGAAADCAKLQNCHPVPVDSTKEKGKGGEQCTCKIGTRSIKNFLIVNIQYSTVPNFQCTVPTSC